MGNPGGGPVGPGEIPTPSGGQPLTVDMYRGMSKPIVDLQEGDEVWIRLEGGDDDPPDNPEEERELLKRKIAVALKKVRFDMHNQSYGMITASTGCASNPGGPGC